MEKQFITTVLGKTYPVVINHLADDPDETLFWPHGEDLEYVLSVDPRLVWSWDKEDSKGWIIRAGYLDDVEGYKITELPWESTNEYGLDDPNL
jgi:hypothetical protein